MLELPIFTNTPSYKYTTEIEGSIYQFQFYFNVRMDRWFMDIMTPASERIISGIPMLTNVDLIGRFRDTRLPAGYFAVFDNTGKNRNPSFDNFGTDIKLYYLTVDEVFA